jgi:hypothetical protein
MGATLGNLTMRGQSSLVWTAARCLTTCVLTDSEAELSARGCRRHGRPVVVTVDDTFLALDQRVAADRPVPSAMIDP